MQHLDIISMTPQWALREVILNRLRLSFEEVGLIIPPAALTSSMVQGVSDRMEMSVTKEELAPLFEDCLLEAIDWFVSSKARQTRLPEDYQGMVNQLLQRLARCHQERSIHCSESINRLVDAQLHWLLTSQEESPEEALTRLNVSWEELRDYATSYIERYV